MLTRLRWKLLRLLAARRMRVDSALWADQRAYRRARRLLRRSLTPAQRLEFDRRRSFTLQAPSGTTYRIGYAASLNIEVLCPAGKVRYRLCAVPEGLLPIPDIMLAQKLMLETQEADFLRIAARYEVWPELRSRRGARAWNPRSVS